MKNFFLFFAALGVICFCGCKDTSKEEKLYQKTIKIGTETWPGYIALFIARDKKFFAEEGLKVEIKRYIALGKLSKDYIAGKLHGRANLTLDAINEKLQGLDHKVVLAIDYSAGADAIAATKDIKTVRDFAGKRVAYEPHTLEEFFLSWALSKYDMSLKDVKQVPGNPEETGNWLKQGKVDVAVTHEPFLSKLTQSKAAHVIYSSKDAPGLITDILTFNTSFIQDNPETIAAILRAYFKALKFLKENPQEGHSILAKEFKVTAKEIKEQLKGVRLLSLRDNITTFSFASGLESLYGNMRKMSIFIQKHQKQNKKVQTDKMIEPCFIKKLQRALK